MVKYAFCAVPAQSWELWSKKAAWEQWDGEISLCLSCNGDGWDAIGSTSHGAHVPVPLLRAGAEPACECWSGSKLGDAASEISSGTRGLHVQVHDMHKKYILFFLSIKFFSDYHYAGFFYFHLDPDTYR